VCSFNYNWVCSENHCGLLNIQVRKCGIQRYCFKIGCDISSILIHSYPPHFLVRCLTQAVEKTIILSFHDALGNADVEMGRRSRMLRTWGLQRKLLWPIWRLVSNYSLQDAKTPKIGIPLSRRFGRSAQIPSR
jgi:hypothetical protein